MPAVSKAVSGPMSEQEGTGPPTAGGQQGGGKENNESGRRGGRKEETKSAKCGKQGNAARPEEVADAENHFHRKVDSHPSTLSKSVHSSASHENYLRKEFRWGLSRWRLKAAWA